MPFVWMIAFATVVAVLEVVARVRDSSIQEMLRNDSDSLWPLAVALPSAMLGLVVGMIVTNLVVFVTPLRHVFERECSETGRHRFKTAMAGLCWFGLVLLSLTVAGSALFILFCP
jgi:hypothetical protein